MKPGGVDRRVLRTQSALKGALLSLIPEKGYEAITIQDVLERANVGRSTFYLHFGDKDELLRSGIADLREELRGALKGAAMTGSKPAERLIGFSRFLFEHTYENREVFWRMGKQGGELVKRAFHQMLVDIINDQAREVLKGKSPAGAPLGLLAHFAASSFFSVLEWWLEQKRPLPPETIDGIYRSLVLPSLSANL